MEKNEVLKSLGENFSSIEKLPENVVRSFGNTLGLPKENFRILTDMGFFKTTRKINGENRDIYCVSVETESKKILPISINSFFRQVYPETDSAVNPKPVIAGLTAKAASNEDLLKIKDVFKLDNTGNYCAPNFINGQPVYKDMVRRTYQFYTV